MREAIDGLEGAVAAHDLELAHRFVDFRYRLAESLGDLWQDGPESARQDLVMRLTEMFDDTTEARQALFAGRPMVRSVVRKDGSHVWVESRVATSGEGSKSFSWLYRLTPRGTTWAITQREYLVDGMPSDSTRFWPMARRQVALKLGRAPTLPELAANLPEVMGRFRIRRLKVPNLDSPSRAPTPPTP